MEIKIPIITKNQKSIVVSNEEDYEKAKTSYLKLLVRCSFISAMLFLLSTIGGMINHFIQMQGSLWWVATGCLMFVMLLLGKLLQSKLYNKGLFFINTIVTGIIALFFFVGGIVILTIAGNGLEPISIETHILFWVGILTAIAPFLSCLISIIWLCCKLNLSWNEQIESRSKSKEEKVKKNKKSKKLAKQKQKLEELKALYEEGLITEQEYNKARKKTIEKD